MKSRWHLLTVLILLLLSMSSVAFAQRDEEYEGEIEDDGQEDEYTIELEEGQGVIITAEADDSDLDTVLRLLNPDGDEVKENDDYEFPDSTNSRILYVAEEDGEYTIIVTHYPDTSGEYILTVEYVDAEEVEEILAETGELEVDTTPERNPDFVFEGEVEDGEEDEYTVELEEGQGVIAALYGTSDDMDTVLTLVDPNGVELISSDDRGDYDTLDSQIAFFPQEDGEYSFVVTNYPDFPGEYRLEIYLASDEETRFAEQALRVVFTGPVETMETENFIIHYTLEGADAADEDFVEEVAEAVEEVLEIQLEMGWALPPTDAGQGGDLRYDVYLTHLPDIYGYASSSSPFGDNPNTDVEEEDATAGFLVIDNDYSEYDDPIQAMRATVAHEFNHVIQFGYDRLEPMQMFSESVASYMEVATFPDDEEATIYVADAFNYPEACFAGEGDADLGGTGVYATWLFFDFASQRLSEDFSIELWENTVEEDGFDALETTLEEYDETIPSFVAQYHINNLLRDYALADEFDDVSLWLENVIDGEGDWEVTGEGIQELGANYFELDADEDTYALSLDTDADLIMYAIGIDGDDADIFFLGDEGVVDNDGYDHFYIMVFNTDFDDRLSDCDYEEYTIEVETTNDDATERMDRLDASNFIELEMND